MHHDAGRRARRNPDQSGQKWLEALVKARSLTGGSAAERGHSSHKRAAKTRNDTYSRLGHHNVILWFGRTLPVNRIPRDSNVGILVELIELTDKPAEADCTVRPVFRIQALTLPLL
eukprot:COSAG02_NODE_7975_length_2762_cov_2.269621_1_plen_116_part_00